MALLIAYATAATLLFSKELRDRIYAASVRTLEPYLKSWHRRESGSQISWRLRKSSWRLETFVAPVWQEIVADRSGAKIRIP